MDILDHMLDHDASSTRRLLEICQGLSEAQWLQPFEFGQGSFYTTFDHMIDSQEFWTFLMQGNTGLFVPVPPDPERSLDGIIQRFEAISPAFIQTAQTIRDAGQLGETFLDLETGPARRSYGATIVHVVTHNMHHRAQVRIMFDLLGVEYNHYAGFAMDAFPIDGMEE